MATRVGARNHTSPDDVGLKLRDSHGAGEHAQVMVGDPCASITRGTVASATDTQTLAAAGVAPTLRRYCRVYNNSSAALYLKEGAGCTSSDFDTVIPAGTEWVMDEPIWTGIVTGAWASVNGDAHVTEKF